MKICRNRIKAYIVMLCDEVKLLINEVPAVTTVLLVMAVFLMNLFANKSIKLPFKWLAVDCGITVSWLVFLILNVVTMHFGPRASTLLSVFASFVNVIISIVLFLVSIIPGNWGEACATGTEELINSALDKTIGGTWYVLLGSTIAFIISAVVNNFLNYTIGKILDAASKKDIFSSRFRAFCKNNATGRLIVFFIRTNVATGVGQFVDNFLFAILVSRVFFSWSLVQCVACAFTGMLVELLCELIFTGAGYKVCRSWSDNEVGKEYLNRYMTDSE